MNPTQMNWAQPQEYFNAYWMSQSRGLSLQTIGSRATKVITCHIPKFQDLVLKPRGIIISILNSITRSLHAHFKTTEPPLEGKIDYNELEGLGGANIWLFCG